MPLSSPFIASCMLGFYDPAHQKPELEMLAKQLDEIEAEKFRKPKTNKNKQAVRPHEKPKHS